MRLIVLNIACPFAPVGPDAAGRPEQIITQLDAALVRAGHESIVMAVEGSVTQGILLSTAKPDGAPDEAAHQRAREQYRYTLRKFLEKWPIDLIHMHGADFVEYLPDPGVPVLVTLYLPPHSYPKEIFRLERPHTFLHCVSSSQRSACPSCANLLENEQLMADPVQAAVLVDPEARQETGRERLFVARMIEKCFSLYEQLVQQCRESEKISEPAVMAGQTAHGRLTATGAEASAPSPASP